MARTAQPTIRLARTADAAPIARMSRRYIEAGLQWNWRAPRVLGHITRSTSNVAVAEQRGNDQQNQMAGFAIMQFNVNVAALCLLAVNPQCRRLGIAARLARWLEVTADTAGLLSIHVEAREDNEAAHGLYDALGFKRSNAYRPTTLAGSQQCGSKSACDRFFSNAGARLDTQCRLLDNTQRFAAMRVATREGAESPMPGLAPDHQRSCLDSHCEF